MRRKVCLPFSRGTLELKARQTRYIRPETRRTAVELAEHNSRLRKVSLTVLAATLYDLNLNAPCIV